MRLLHKFNEFVDLALRCRRDRPRDRYIKVPRDVKRKNLRNILDCTLFRIDFLNLVPVLGVQVRAYNSAVGHSNICLPRH